MIKKKIVIIGAEHGAAAAWNLSKISNYEVICMEQGGEEDPKEYDYLSNEWEKINYINIIKIQI